jgi:hypothetical protein
MDHKKHKQPKFLSMFSLRSIAAKILPQTNFHFYDKISDRLKGWTGFGSHTAGRSYRVNPVHPVQTA